MRSNDISKSDLRKLFCNQLKWFNNYMYIGLLLIAGGTFYLFYFHTSDNVIEGTISRLAVIIGVLFMIAFPIEKKMFINAFYKPENWLLDFQYEDKSRLIITHRGIVMNKASTTDTDVSFNVESIEYGLEDLRSLFEKNIAGAIVPDFKVTKTTIGRSYFGFYGVDPYFIFSPTKKFIAMQFQHKWGMASMSFFVPKEVEFTKVEFMNFIQKMNNKRHCTWKIDNSFGGDNPKEGSIETTTSGIGL